MVYAVFWVLGAVLPLSPAILFLASSEGNVGGFVQQAIASPAAVTAWLDVMLTALVLLTVIWQKRQPLSVRQRWLLTLATVVVGPSLGLPLWLYQRSRSPQSVELPV